MSNLPAELDHLKRGLTATQARTKPSGGEQFLRLLKSGEWVYGQDDTDVEKDSLWAVDPNSFMTGYIAWDQDPDTPAKVLGQEMRRAIDPPVVLAELPDVGAPWDLQLGVMMLCLTGEDKGLSVSYKTTSKGGTRAINEMMVAVIDRLNKGESDVIVPVVKLQTDSYKHKTYGKIYVPVLEIVRWESLASNPDAAAEAIEEEAEAEPEEKAESEAPRRRRRRRAA